MARKNLRKLTPDEVQELRRLVSSKGWTYLKDIGEEMADAIEGPITGDEKRIVRGAVFRRTIRGFFDAIESIEQPVPSDKVTRMLNHIMNTQPTHVIKEVE